MQRGLGELVVYNLCSPPANTGGCGPLWISHTLASCYMTHWEATSGHSEQLLANLFATLQVITTNSAGKRAQARPWGEEWPPSELLFRPFSLHFSFHVNFSTPFTPPHSDIPLLNAAGVSFFFCCCCSETPHICLYRKLQPSTVLMLFSVLILTTAMHNYLCSHPSDLQFSTLI